MKKRKTRLLCLLLTLAMALTLCACGGDKASSDPNHIVLEDCTTIRARFSLRTR